MRRKPLADRTLEKLAAAQAAGVGIRQLARNRSSAERQEIEQLVAEWLHNGTITERGYTHRGEPCYVGQYEHCCNQTQSSYFCGFSMG
jgi:hypothetical protein